MDAVEFRKFQEGVANLGKMSDEFAKYLHVNYKSFRKIGFSKEEAFLMVIELMKNVLHR